MTTETRPFLRRGPSGPRANTPDGGGIIQVGYDQPIKTVTIGSSPPVPVVPRDADGNPLQVILPGVTPGNFLEVDYRILLVLIGESDVAATFRAIVSFDGVTPAVFPTNFFYLNNANTGGEGLAAVDTPLVVTSLCLVEIPDGAVDAIVQIFYQASDSGLQITGTDLSGSDTSSCTLKVTEISADIVAQAGPSTLIAAP